MEQEKENQAAEGAQPIENDLFSITASQGDRPAAEPEAEPVSPESASGTDFGSGPEPVTESQSVPEPESSPEAADAPSGPVSDPPGEPEFKINPEDRPAIRILNQTSSAPSSSSPASRQGLPPVSLRSSINASIGTMLSEARSLAGYSIEDVHQRTQIKSTYIEALEKDQFDALPNRVFLRAYVRALIALYRLDPASVSMLEDQLSELTPVTDIPDKLVESIGKEGHVNEAEVKRIKMIFISGAVILLLLISLTVTSIISVRVRNRRIRTRRQQTEQVFDSSRIDTLLPPQLPPPRMMDVPPAEDKKP